VCHHIRATAPLTRAKSRHHIRVVRQTFDQLTGNGNARLETNTRQLYITRDPGIVPSGSVEIAVVYYRSGYAPTEYTTANHYSARFLLERSRAIKCPTIALQLAGGKKIQQVLTQPGVLESFLCDPKKGTVFAPTEVEAVRNTFMAMWGLDASEDGADSDHEATRIQREEHGVRRARENAHSLVLKPQREGGGNNVYKEDILAFLDRLEPRERQAWVAMELITPPRGTGNYLLRTGNNSNHGVVKTEVISELGIYGWALFGNSETVVENEGGWLLRTKEKESNEGGVATGFSVLDSLLLIDD
jgi:glutathione synthetase